MNILMNIIVLIFEVLYYSMFMYYAKKEGKFWRYILLFSLITIIGLFIGTSTLFSYALLVIMILFGIKYIVKVKTIFYHLFIIFIMLAFKIIIEGILYMTIYCFYRDNFILTMIAILTKNLIIFINRNKLFTFYNKLKALWDKNNFYIKYAFIIFMFLFVIFSVIFLLIK